MNRFEVSCPSTAVKKEAFDFWLKQIRAVKKLANMENLNIYDLQESKTFGKNFTELHNFALNFMFKLNINQIKPEDIKSYKLKNELELITIFDMPAQIIYKKIFEQECVNNVYYKRMGWEK